MVGLKEWLNDAFKGFFGDAAKVEAPKTDSIKTISVSIDALYDNIFTLSTTSENDGSSNVTPIGKQPDKLSTEEKTKKIQAFLTECKQNLKAYGQTRIPDTIITGTFHEALLQQVKEKNEKTHDDIEATTKMIEYLKNSIENPDTGEDNTPLIKIPLELRSSSTLEDATQQIHSSSNISIKSGAQVPGLSSEDDITIRATSSAHLNQLTNFLGFIKGQVAPSPSSTADTPTKEGPHP